MANYLLQGRPLPFRTRTEIRFPGKLRESQYRCGNFEGLCHATGCEGEMFSGFRGGDRCWEKESESDG
jgi:hypothetical protein